MYSAENIDWDTVERQLRSRFKKPKEILSLADRATTAVPRPRLNKYLPPVNKNIKPLLPKQEQFLMQGCMEMFYGGAAGGAKSSALLLGALQYCDVPGYNALLLRRTFAELSKPGALMDLAHQWLQNTDAVWSSFNKWWVFPSGAKLCFGYLESDADKYQYQSSAWQYIGPDEIAEWPLESTYRFMFSRLRKPEGMAVPLRMRCAGNPVGPGAAWCKQRFIVATGSDGKTESEARIVEDAAEEGEEPIEYVRKYMPSRLKDNFYLDKSYRQSLAALDKYLRVALENGDWDVKPPGKMFNRRWFNNFVELMPGGDTVGWVRFWDLAATEDRGNNDPSWTCGVRMGYDQDMRLFYLADIRRVRETSHKVEQLIKMVAQTDGPYCDIVIEQEPGSSGLAVVDYYKRAMPNRNVSGYRPTGPKAARASLVASKVEAGLVVIVRETSGSWLEKFLDEVEQFPPESNSIKCDQVDAFSGAYIALAEPGDADLGEEGFVTFGERLRPDW